MRSQNRAGSTSFAATDEINFYARKSLGAGVSGRFGSTRDPDRLQRPYLDLSGILMTLAYIAAFIVAAALLGLITNSRWRVNLLLAVSALAVFALQPILPVRGLDFYLPTFTLTLATLAWVITTPREARTWKTNWPGAAILIGIILVLAVTRYLGIPLVLTASRPPPTLTILVLLAILLIATLALTRFTTPGKRILTAAFIAVILVFAILKIPAISLQVSLLLRTINGQALTTASSLDIRWLGYSYIAFRLLHTIRDRQSGRLPPVSLPEYVVYVIFFPTLSAGPIDRIERFSGDLRRPPERNAEDWGEAGKRLTMGLFKKFVLADGLALIALNAADALQVRSPGWAWVLLYAYAFQIFFDFSGYTDIAIGTARLMGFKLPENFNAPYLKPNLTQFWNNWHMTLTQWFRAYFFNPFTRALRSSKKHIPIPVIILVTQLATMVLIGLWHGVTLNFILWGLWHGLGLFIHNRWSERTKAKFAALSVRWQKRLNAAGVILTFHFVTLSWIFFALPEPKMSFHFLQILIGLG
jgi:alginate O-acetyltransferase complex protein AlgI